MTYDLFDITLRVARELGILYESTATGGSTTTIVDTVMLTQGDDYWNNGVAWITYDAGGASAAPEGEYKVISDFADTGDTITVSSAYSAAVASGDRYAVCRKFGGFNWLGILTQKVNQAFVEIGPVPFTDTSSITTEASKTEYPLPAAAKGGLRRVWIQTNTGDTDDYQWRRITDYTVEYENTGSADTLVLFNQPDTGKLLKLEYVAMHPELSIATSQLNEHVPIQRVVYPAVRDCFKFMRDSTEQSRWDDKIKGWEDKAEQAKIDFPIHKPQRSHRTHVLTDRLNNYPGDRTPR